MARADQLDTVQFRAALEAAARTRRPKRSGVGSASSQRTLRPSQFGTLVGCVLLSVFFGRFAVADLHRSDWGDLAIALGIPFLCWVAVVVRHVVRGLDVGPELVRDRRLGRAREWRASELGAVVTLRAGGRYGRAARTDGVLVGSDGAPVLRLRGDTWSIRQIRAVAEHAGLPLVERDASVRVRDANEVLPGYASLRERHPVASWLVWIALAFIAAIVYVSLTA